MFKREIGQFLFQNRDFANVCLRFLLNRRVVCELHVVGIPARNKVSVRPDLPVTGSTHVLRYYPPCWNAATGHSLLFMMLQTLQNRVF